MSEALVWFPQKGGYLSKESFHANEKFHTFPQVTMAEQTSHSLSKAGGMSRV